MNNVITEIPTNDDIYARDEEEASLALLIEQLKHKEQEGANSLLTLSTMDHSCLVGGSTTTIEPTMSIVEPSSSPSSPSRTKMVDQDFHDCYTSLGTLPEVGDTYSYNYICDQIIDEKTL